MIYNTNITIPTFHVNNLTAVLSFSLNFYGGSPHSVRVATSAVPLPLHSSTSFRNAFGAAPIANPYASPVTYRIRRCLNYAKAITKNNCYKMMLLTGIKNEHTLHFYKNDGYNSEDTTACIHAA